MKLFAVISFLLSSSLAYSLNYLETPDSSVFNVRGIVTDSKTFTPLANAEVALVEAKKDRLIGYGVTDTNGRFSVKVIKEGEYTLYISMMGYNKHIQNIKLEKGNSNLDLGDIRLKEGLVLDEVTVSAETPLLTYEPFKISYDVSRDPDRFKISMLRMMEKLPFTRINEKGRIEHKTPDIKYIILINGEEYRLITSSRQYPMSFIKAEYMKNIEIISPPPARFSEYDAAINIILSKPLPDGYTFEISSGATTRNSFDVDPEVVTKLGNVVVSLDYSLKTSDPPALANKFYQENYLSENLRFTFKNNSTESSSTNQGVSLGASYTFRDKSYVSLGVGTDFGKTLSESINHTSLNNYQNFVNEELTVTTTNKQSTLPRVNLGLKFYKPLKNNGGHLQVMYNFNNSVLDKEKLNNDHWLLPFDSTIVRTTKQNTNTLQQNIKAYLSRRLNETNQLSFSANYVLRDYSNISDYSVISPVNDGILRDNNGLDYVQKIMEISSGYSYQKKKISASASLKLNSLSNSGEYINSGIRSKLSYNETILIPRFTVSYSFKNNKSIGFTYLGVEQRPGISLLNPYLDKTDPYNIVQGNPGLKSEYANSFDLYYSYRSRNNFAIMTTLRGEFVDNSIERMTIVNEENITVTSYENLGKKKIFFANVQLSYSLYKKISISSQIGINRIFYSGVNIKNDNTSISANLFASGTIWKGGKMTALIDLRNNPLFAQSVSSNLMSSFYFSLNQSIIKERLYGGISVSNPFKNRKTIINEMHTDNYYIKEEHQELGRTIRFWLRFTFGNFKERVKGVDGAYSDDLKKF
ncbi:MAG: outer membrane beta-barrel family protein [Bacteroidales bacterium]|nr:outer membrane beta-barrel protein [Bacteroidales bacterium]MDD2425563.1 outer membrane beta-barrel family protein [Bacteroidales bacterium]MDD3989419.1 outer membrane beta-barrel family protein [Bacteroidales bacterium]MDD4639530.1 outer membrane beta-barrel family protein [Bacteroidales bacterium]